MDHRKLIKVSTAADILNEHRNNIYWYMQKKQLNKYIIDGSVFVARHEVEELKSA